MRELSLLTKRRLPLFISLSHTYHARTHAHAQALSFYLSSYSLSLSRICRSFRSSYCVYLGSFFLLSRFDIQYTSHVRQTPGAPVRAWEGKLFYLVGKSLYCSFFSFIFFFFSSEIQTPLDAKVSFVSESYVYFSLTLFFIFFYSVSFCFVI